MKSSELISMFQLMYKEHWSYVWGSAKYGCVDCSGAFTYAYAKLGSKIAHGSNTIGRKYIVGKLLPISEAKPGMAAFKNRAWTESQQGNTWYGSQPGDLHHIGLVDDDTGYVLNAKGQKSGFCRDKLTAKNGWTHVAYLKDVDYETDTAGGGVMEEATVVLPSGASGTTVNMRAGANKTAKIIVAVPVGSTITVMEDYGTWCRINYNGKTGYMMSNFIEYNNVDGDGETDGGNTGLSSDEAAKIDQALRHIEDAMETIDKAKETIGLIVGRG